jgi:hypothetical protein
VADDTNKVSFFNKEMLVVLPVIGSTIAITYDVGYFFALDINFFTVFTISEHVAFALEILPLAILATILLVVGPIVADKGYQGGRAQAKRESVTPTAKKKWYAKKSFWFEVVFFFWLVYWANHTRYVFSFVMILVWLISTVMVEWFVIYFLRPVVWIGFSSFVCLTMSFAIGMDVSISYRNSTKYPYTVKTADGELKAKVIRSGDRGLMFHDEASKQLLILPWSEIKRVSSSSPGAGRISFKFEF